MEVTTRRWRPSEVEVVDRGVRTEHGGLRRRWWISGESCGVQGWAAEISNAESSFRGDGNTSRLFGGFGDLVEVLTVRWICAFGLGIMRLWERYRRKGEVRQWGRGELEGN